MSPLGSNPDAWQTSQIRGKIATSGHWPNQSIQSLLSPSDEIYSFKDVFYHSAMINCGIVVERVCRLPRDFRLVGTKSIIQLAEEIGLPSHRECITSSAVKSQLLAQPELVDDWLLWSADQRCSPAWYFCKDGEEYIVGYGPNGEEMRFANHLSACTQFVIHEVENIIAMMAS